MWPLLRWLFFRLEPERAHHVALRLLQITGATPPLRGLLDLLYRAPAYPPLTLWGRTTFPNPIGLAAGWDKDGLAFRGLASMGFGHVELGTVTPRAQPGNPRPRVFRLPEDHALINRMGFPSRGADVLAARLQRRRDRGWAPRLVLGVNLGKNKDTPLESAVDDYLVLLERFAPLCDYLVVNLSSPNTPGLRALQARDALEPLLRALVARRQALGSVTPILAKLAPDLDDAQRDGALEAALAAGIDGLVATNTTLARTGLRSPRQSETGGASGACLTHRATEFVAALHRATQGHLPSIAAGGVMNADDAKAKLDAGASLVQLWTGLVYGGPSLPRRIVQELLRRERLLGDRVPRV